LTIYYYNHIGDETSVSPNFMRRLCYRHHGMTCIRLQHFNEASEAVTLQAAYEFCRNNADSRIIYLHTKGSYNARKNQQRWRRRMTKAVTTRKCLDNVGDLASGQCSTCGMLFFPVWMCVYPGNFFAAHCDYLRKLIPPLDYEAQNEQTYCSKPLDLQMMLFPNQYDTSGRGRYSNEGWVGSHPALLPCDLSVTHNIDTWWYGRANYQFDFYRGVRHNLSSAEGWAYMIPHRMDMLRNDPSLRRREYTLLPGLLWKWHELYGRFPSHDSWVWTTFPDGQYWQQTTIHNGIKALDMAWAAYP
jgi:hypothetical protein